MNYTTTYKGVPLAIRYEYDPGCPDTHDTPGLPERVDIVDIHTGGMFDIMPILSDEVVMELEQLILNEYED